MRLDLVVIVQDVVLVRLGGHLDHGARDVVVDGFGNPFDADIGEFFLEERVDAFLRQLPPLPGRGPGDEVAGRGLRGSAPRVAEQAGESRRAKAERRAPLHDLTSVEPAGKGGPDEFLSSPEKITLVHLNLPVRTHDQKPVPHGPLAPLCQSSGIQAHPVRCIRAIRREVLPLEAAC